jgi:hypothetical protein
MDLQPDTTSIDTTSIDTTSIDTTDKFVFSELKLFVCTYVAKLENIHVNFEKLTHILCDKLSGNILAVNSNYGHASQVGYERFIKVSKKETTDLTKGRMRKIQGDGTCFNSAIEPVIRLDDSTDKYYFIKCFPSTGETQIPGVIRHDLQDGHDVLTVFVSLLNSLNLGTVENDQIKPIYILSEGPKMLNYKFKLGVSPDTLINLMRLSEYLFALVIEFGSDCQDDQDDYCPTFQEHNNWFITKPPYCLKEVKSSIDDIKVSFRFQTSKKRAPRVNIFQGGKVNILGSESTKSSEHIYTFLNGIFKNNWKKLISVRPVKDLPY